jgi:tRNA threonylcarbamoyladenosine biosynthesis protein TsaB
MLTLAMDTATSQVGVAVGRDGTVLASDALDAGRRHAEELVPAIRRVLAEAGVGLPDLHFVSCGIGPGLFTGLRVGVTTARTLGQVLGLPAVGVPSLDLVARPWTGEGHEVVALIDARRREVFSARYAAGGDGRTPMDGYSVGPPAVVAEELAARGRRTLLVGDGAVVHAASFADLDHVDLIGAEAAAPSLAALVTLATERFRAGDHHAPEALLPLYLRRSDAEIAWEGR